jgi:hypothetical protein
MTAGARLRARARQFRGDERLASNRLLEGAFGNSMFVILEERRIAPGASRGRKVRTPEGVMPRNLVLARIHAGSKAERPCSRIVPQKRYRPAFPECCGCRLSLAAAGFRKGWVRVKWRGKSPPLQAQARRQGKPHQVQGQIGDLGAARSSFRTAEGVPGTGC